MNFILIRPILHYGLTTIIFITLLSQPTSADSPGRPDSDPGSLYTPQKFSSSMGVIIIVIIAALFFMGFFSIYIRHCTGGGSGGASRRGIIGAVARSVRGQRGLDRAVVESFPTFTYSAVKELKIGKGALECAVCLTEFDDDDTLRLIPKCDHAFHPDCIDEWLAGHTTCPVCRSNLADGGGSVHAPPEIEGNDAVVGPIDECENPSSCDVEDPNSIPEERESMEQPLQGTMSRSRTMRRSNSIGRPRWFGKFTRSFSTGHVAVKQWERFTLRLPEEVRKQVIGGNLERSTSLVVLPRERSSRRGYRTGFGEGSNRPSRFGSVRVDRGVRSDRWVFSLAPPFFSRAPSLRSPKDGVDSRQGSVRVEPTRLPV